MEMKSLKSLSELWKGIERRRLHQLEIGIERKEE
jgi:hypothetical protein